jgi:hypothetical protein
MSDFKELDTIKAIMNSFAGDYWIAGGWAVDLHLGRQTRHHKDIEIAIDRVDQNLLTHLPDLMRIEFVENKTWGCRR